MGILSALGSWASSLAIGLVSLVVLGFLVIFAIKCFRLFIKLFVGLLILSLLIGLATMLLF